MATQALDIVGSSKPGRDKKFDSEATYNMIITNVDEAQGITGLTPYAGYSSVADLIADLGARGEYYSPNGKFIIAITGRSVLAIQASTTSFTDKLSSTNLISYNQVGSLKTDTGFVFIKENEAGQIAMVDGVYIYLYNWRTNNFESVLPDFSPVHIAYQDGYFLIADGNSNEFRLSNLNDGATYPEYYTGALETKTANTCVAIIAQGRQVLVLGKTTGEIYYDEPSQNTGVLIQMPYQRDSSITIDYGCMNAATAQSGFGRTVWLGSSEISNPVILMSTGGPPQVISTDGINYIMSTMDDPSDAYAFIFQQDGHILYQITFVTDNRTFIVDLDSGLFFYGTDQYRDAHIAKFVVYYPEANTHYMLSRIDNKFYEMSSSLSTYDGNIIPRIRICSPKRTQSYQLYPIKLLGIICKTGYQDSTMAIDLSISKDGGETFGNTVRRDLNPVGMRRKIVRWRQLGISRDWVFQFIFSGADAFYIISAYMEAGDDAPFN